jgi:hypothetical protein
MRYKCTVARIWVLLPRWSRVERKSSVEVDGSMSWMPPSAGRVDTGQMDSILRDRKLKDALHIHGVPAGRTNKECCD